MWKGRKAPEIVELPIGQDDGQWVARLNRMPATGNFSGQRATRHMIEAYRRLPTVAEDELREVMRLAADDSRRPLLIHCTSGKDRTGVAVALILEAVGVSRQVVMTDFPMTNEVANVQARLRIIAREYADSRAQTGHRTLRGAPRAADFLPLIGVTREMLEAFYAGVEEDYGSMDTYLNAIGLDENGRAALVAALIE